MDIQAIFQEWVQTLKTYYYAAEDRYYNFLDTVNEKIPVYKVIDTVDEYIPSFLIVLGVALLLLLLLLNALLAPVLGPLFGGILNLFGLGGHPYLFRVVDTGGEFLQGVEATVSFNGGSQSAITDAFGEFQLTLPTSDVRVGVMEDGYEPFEESLVLSATAPNVITLETLSLLFDAGEKILEIQDERGNLISVAAKVRFACSGNATNPPSITTRTGIATVLSPAQCGNLTATVSAEGFEENTATLQGDRTIIRLKALVIQTGRVIVNTRAAGTDVPLEGIKVNLLSEEGVLLNFGRTDPTGTYAFEKVTPGTYFIRADDESGMYASRSSDEVLVQARDEKVVNLVLGLLPAQDRKKIFLKFAERGNNDSIENAFVTIFSNGAEYSDATTKPDGTVFFQVDGNAAYTFSVTHPRYVASFGAAPLLEPSDTSPSVILLDPIEEDPDTGNPVNYGIITVQVNSAEGEAVAGAEVNLHRQNGNAWVSTLSNSNGEAGFRNLPEGVYFATASKNSAEGISPTIELMAGQELGLEVTLVLATSTLELTVLDTAFNPLPGTGVRFYDSFNDQFIAESTTDIEGVVEQDFRWTTRPYAIVERTGFYTDQTQTYVFQPKSTLREEKVMQFIPGGPEDPNEPPIEPPPEKIDILLTTIEEDNGKTANVLKDDSEYTFKFKIVVDEDARDVMAVVRTGLAENLQADNSLIVVQGVQVARAIPTFSQSYDAGNNYADVSITSGDAKQVRMEFGDLNAGSYDFAVNVYIKDVDDLDLPNKSPVEVHYGVRSRTAEIPAPRELKLARFTLGEKINCNPKDPDCQNFFFQFTVVDTTGDHFQSPMDVAPGEVFDLLIDGSYELQYLVFNFSKDRSTYSNANLTFTFDPNLLSLSPTSQSISRFPVDTSISGSTLLEPQNATFSTGLDVNLNLGVVDDSAHVSFRIGSRKPMNVVIQPDPIIGGRYTTISVTLQDGNTLIPLPNGTIKIDFVGNTDPEILGTTDEDGIFTTLLPRSGPPLGVGQTITITAERFGFETQVIELITQSPGLPQLANYDCLDVTPAAMEVQHFTQTGTFTVATTDCIEPIDIYLYQKAAVKGNKLLDAQNPSQDYSDETKPFHFSLSENDSKTIRVFANEFIGEYGVFLAGRFENFTNFQDFAEVQVIVRPPGAVPAYCFDFDQTDFNIFQAIGSGALTNRCHYYIDDLGKPALTIGSNQWQSQGNQAPALIRISPEQIARLQQQQGLPRPELVDVSLSPPIAIGTGQEAEEFAFTISTGKFNRVSAVDFFMTDGEHCTDAVGNVDSPDTATVNCISRDRHKIFVEELLDRVSSTSQSIRISGPPLYFPSVVIDGNGMVDTDTSVSGTTVTDLPIWQGRHNLCDDLPAGCLYEDPLIEAGYQVDTYANEVRINAENYTDPAVPSSTSLSGYRYSYQLEDPDNAGVIEYEILNNGLIGESYAVIEVTDYIAVTEAAPTFQTYTTDITLTGSGFIFPQDTSLLSGNTTVGPASLIGFSMDENLANRSLITAGQPELPEGGSQDLSSLDFSEVENQLCGREFKDLNHLSVSFTPIKSGGGEPEVAVGMAYHRQGLGWRLFILRPYAHNTPVTLDFFAGTDPPLLNGNPIGSTGFTMNNVDCIALFNNEHDANSSVMVTNVFVESVQDLFASREITASFVDDGIPEVLDIGVPIIDLDTQAGGFAIHDELYTVASNVPQVRVVFEQSGASATTNPAENLVGVVNAALVCDPNTAPGGNCEQLSTSANHNKIQVRLRSKSDDLCFGHNNLVGTTGPDSLPKTALTWDWDNIDPDFCEYSNPEGVYCDSTQFTITLLKRIKGIMDAYEDNDLTTVQNLSLHNVNLTRDGFSQDFINDFDEYYRTLSFLGAPDYYSDPFTGLHKFLEDPQRFSFDPAIVHEGGTYTADIEILFDTGAFGRFFIGDTPSASIRVTLTPLDLLEPTEDNPFYLLALNGEVGLNPNTDEYHRDGYGTGYTGAEVLLSETVGSGGTIERITTLNTRGNPASRMRVMEEDALQNLNQVYRGSVVRLGLSQDPSYDLDLTFSPSIATPVIMRVSDFLSDASTFYYLRDETGPVSTGAFNSLWTGAASTFPDCTAFDGRRLFHNAPDYSAALGGVSCTLQPNIAASQAYGFGFSNVPPGDIYLKSIFYTPTTDYSIVPACSQGTQFFATPLGPSVDGVTPLQLNYTASVGRTVESVGGLLQMARETTMCISQPYEGNVEIWWNPEPLYEDLEGIASNFLTGSECSDLQVIDPTRNNAPIPLLDLPDVATAGTPITVKGNGVDPEFDPLSFTLTLGDGTTEFSDGPLEVSHTYSSPGNYTVILEASDGKGTGSVSKSIAIIPRFPNGQFDQGMNNWVFSSTAARWPSPFVDTTPSDTLTEVSAAPSLFRGIDGPTFVFGTDAIEVPDIFRFNGELKSDLFMIPDEAEYLALQIAFEYENLDNTPTATISAPTDLVSYEGVYVDLWGGGGNHIDTIASWTAQQKSTRTSAVITERIPVGSLNPGSSYYLTFSLVGDEDADDNARIAVDRVCWSDSKGECI